MQENETQEGRSAEARTVMCVPVKVNNESFTKISTYFPTAIHPKNIKSGGGQLQVLEGKFKLCSSLNGDKKRN